MSWEAWGDPDTFDIEELHDHGWESDEDGERWWREGELWPTFSLDEAIAAYRDNYEPPDPAGWEGGFAENH
jgi:hypothetical protein